MLPPGTASLRGLVTAFTALQHPSGLPLRHGVKVYQACAFGAWVATSEIVHSAPFAHLHELRVSSLPAGRQSPPHFPLLLLLVIVPPADRMKSIRECPTAALSTPSLDSGPRGSSCVPVPCTDVLLAMTWRVTHLLRYYYCCCCCLHRCCCYCCWLLHMADKPVITIRKRSSSGDNYEGDP